MASTRSFDSVCWLFLSACLAIMVIRVPAGADDGNDLVTLLSNEALSEPEAQTLVDLLGPTQPFTVSDYDDCPPNDPNKPPNYSNIIYKTFVPQGGGNPVPILMNEYDPPDPNAGPFTIILSGIRGGLAAPGQRRALGAFGRAVYDEPCGKWWLPRTPWPGPRRRHHVEAVREFIGDRLVVDAPPLELGPGLVGRALHAEVNRLQSFDSLVELLAGDGDLQDRLIVEEAGVRHLLQLGRLQEHGGQELGLGLDALQQRRQRNPIARHSRPWIGSSSGATAENSAAESITASSAINHDAKGWGDRNRSRMG